MADTNQLIERIAILEKRIEAIENQRSPIQSNNSINQKKQSAKEFLLSKSISGSTQKTLALAYYLEHNEGLTSFNVPDLEKIFQLAKEKKPANLNDLINKNISKGYIMDAPEKRDSKKTWTLTASGENFVEKELS